MADKDRTVICRIVSEMLDNPGDCDIYPTGRCYDALEKLVEGARIEGVGWAQADACAALDRGEDPRKLDCADILKRAQEDLGKA